MPPSPRTNIFRTSSEGKGQAEFVERLAQGDGVRVERIVSRGHTSPPGFWYDQAEAEWVLVVAGSARLQLHPDRMIELGAGDHLFIAPHERHRVDWTDPSCDTIWIAVYFASDA